MNIRIPLIEGVNDNNMNIHKSAKFIARLKDKKIHRKHFTFSHYSIKNTKN